jgi:hypothetical protein
MKFAWRRLVAFRAHPNLPARQREEYAIMMEIAGVMISGVSLLNDLWGRYKDLSAWTEADLLVDGEYVSLALAKGQLEGSAEQFVWSREDRVPTRELRGTHSVVNAFNAEKKIMHRLCQGRPDDRLILMKKVLGGALVA